jgi:hypothetical protein
MGVLTSLMAVEKQHGESDEWKEKRMSPYLVTKLRIPFSLNEDWLILFGGFCLVWQWFVFLMFQGNLVLLFSKWYCIHTNQTAG